MCMMTLHWEPFLWMAPLQIKLKRESLERGSASRRVLVQFAQSTGVEISGGQKTTVGQYSKVWHCTVLVCAVLYRARRRGTVPCS